MPCLEFTTSTQYAAISFAKKLNGIDSANVAVWVYPRRAGEQNFVLRGDVVTDAYGNRRFPPEKSYVNFLVGTDRNGFLAGAVHGNGQMPFPFVTLNEPPPNFWSHLVVTKDKAGFARFYINGVMVASDLESSSAPATRPFVDTAEDGPPIVLQMQQGGLMGEVAVYGTALSDAEVRQAFEAGRARYRPMASVRPIRFREITQKPGPELWNRAATDAPDGTAQLTEASWKQHRDRITANLPRILGSAPQDVQDYYKKRDAIKTGDFSSLAADLDARTTNEQDVGDYTRRKVSLKVQTGDTMHGWLLIPKKPIAAKSPAVIAIYGTTSGAGKDSIVGLSGRAPGSPPVKSRDFAVDFVKSGFVVLAPDLLRDGERIAPGDRPYDTTRFYKQFPDWSIHAKDAYDLSRAVDYLQSLEFVDPTKIAMTGHSYGGHTTIFATALEPRIKAAAASGPVSDFLDHGLHWAVPKGAGNSQSMPHLRPYVLAQYPHLAPADFRLPAGDPRAQIPVTFYEFTALIAPRPLLVFQAVGERRPMEEENAAAVSEVYRALGRADAVQYFWHPGDHDYPPAARQVAAEWFKGHLIP